VIRLRVAINGFGRIGRAVFKIALEKGVNVVAINNKSDIRESAYALRYDSVYGKYNREVKVGKDCLIVNGKRIIALNEEDPRKLPWKKLKIDVVIESTGIFTERKKAGMHLEAGAKRILVSAPSNDADITLIPGVNEEKLKKEHRIISVASCTTNCLAPVIKVLNDNYGVKHCLISTIHAYTSSQNLLDNAEKGRKGRGAAINIIPTTSGATSSTAKAIPELTGRLDGLAFRVPVAVGSVLDVVAEVKHAVGREQVNMLFKRVAQGKMKGIIEYSEEELVSSDIIGNQHSAIVDGKSTFVSGNLVKVIAWYDNEYGYSNRMVDAVKLVGRYL
jgi:glyceraldehyde 3-phosphate dehydrogenase